MRPEHYSRSIITTATTAIVTAAATGSSITPAYAADSALTTVTAGVKAAITKLDTDAGTDATKYDTYLAAIGKLDPKDISASITVLAAITNPPKNLKTVLDDLADLATKSAKMEQEKTAAGSNATAPELAEYTTQHAEVSKRLDTTFKAEVNATKADGALAKLDACFKAWATDKVPTAAKLYPGLDTEPAASERLSKLTSALGPFNKALLTRTDLEKISPKNDALSPAALSLTPDKDGHTSADTLTSALDALFKNMDEAAKRITTLVNAQVQETQSKTLEVVQKGNNLRRRRAGAVAEAYVARSNANDYGKLIDSLLSTWGNNKKNITERYAADATATDKSIETLKTSKLDLLDSANQISTLLISANDSMVTQEVRLSYFPNVEKLMRFLNPTTRAYDPTNGKAVEDNTTARNNLLNTEASIAEKRADVENIKTRRQRVQAEVLRIRRNAADAQTRLERARGQVLGLSDALSELQGKLDKSTETAEQARLQKQIADVKAKQTLQDEVMVAATTDKDNADADLKALADQGSVLTQEEDAALADQKNAQAALNELRKSLPGMGESEAQSFAAMRDNSPYLMAEPVFDDPDPTRRIFIFGFPDSRTLYLRGDRDSISAARDVIAEFDKPAPQAKLTFYTMQFSGEESGPNANGKDSGLKAPAAMDIVSEQLDGVRQYTEQTVSALRDALAQEIDTSAQKDNKAAVPTALRSSRGRLSRYQFYTPAVSRALGLHLGNDGIPFGDSKMLVYDAAVTRYTLPDPTRLTTLGEIIFVLALGRQKSRDAVQTEFEVALKDLFTALDPPTNPSGAGTPPAGAAPPQSSISRSAAFANAKPVSRPKTLKESIQKVLLRLKTDMTYAGKNDEGGFSDRISTLLKESLSQVFSLPKSKITRLSGSKVTVTTVPPVSNPLIFNNATVIVNENVALGGAGGAGTATDAVYEQLTPVQKEILDALLSKARTDVAGTVYSITRRLEDMPSELRYKSQAARELREQYLPLVGWLSWGGSNTDASSPGAANTSADTIEPKDWRTEGLKALTFDGGTTIDDLPTDDLSLNKVDRLAFEIARTQYDANPLSKTTGRIEAADMLIRSLIDNYNDRLETLVRRPALIVIREQISNLNGVSFGGVEETSFIATNREVSRVDPRASASLTVEEQAQAGEAANALAALYTKQQERQTTKDGILGAVANAAITGAASGNTGLTIASGVTSLLATLLGPGANGKDAENTPPGEIYSISSGNQYKITPIFGPSGQAMRFQFDFAGATRIRDPEGTLNPALPRIERYTVNTEIGLNNLEMRPITSFDSDYQLGQPRRQSGGLPFLNQVPGLKYVPIVGYFTVREGKQAIRQHSVIVAQTVMYPTIGDIAGLMLDGASLPVTFSPEPPFYSREPSERSAFQEKLKVDSPNLDSLESFLITVALNRPAKKEGVITLRIGSQNNLEFEPSVFEASRTIARGQDHVVFSVQTKKGRSGGVYRWQFVATFDDGSGAQESVPYTLSSDAVLSPADINIAEVDPKPRFLTGDEDLVDMTEGIIKVFDVSLNKSNTRLRSYVRVSLSDPYLNVKSPPGELVTQALKERIRLTVAQPVINDLIAGLNAMNTPAAKDAVKSLNNLTAGEITTDLDTKIKAATDTLNKLPTVSKATLAARLTKALDSSNLPTDSATLEIEPVFQDDIQGDLKGKAIVVASTSQATVSKPFKYIIHPALEWEVSNAATGSNHQIATFKDKEPVTLTVDPGGTLNVKLDYTNFVSKHAAGFTVEVQDVKLRPSESTGKAQDIPLAPSSIEIKKGVDPGPVTLTLPPSFTGSGTLSFRVHYSNVRLPDRTITVQVNVPAPSAPPPAPAPEAVVVPAPPLEWDLSNGAAGGAGSVVTSKNVMETLTAAKDASLSLTLNYSKFIENRPMFTVALTDVKFTPTSGNAALPITPTPNSVEIKTATPSSKITFKLPAGVTGDGTLSLTVRYTGVDLPIDIINVTVHVTP